MELGYSLSQLKNLIVSHGVCSEKLTEPTDGDRRDIYNSMFSMVSGEHQGIMTSLVRSPLEQPIFLINCFVVNDQCISSVLMDRFVIFILFFGLCNKFYYIFLAVKKC